MDDYEFNDDGYTVRASLNSRHLRAHEADMRAMRDRRAVTPCRFDRDQDDSEFSHYAATQMGLLASDQDD